jgi:hypothetical protein
MNDRSPTEIKKEIAFYEGAKDVLHKQFQNAMKELDENISEVRKLCSHSSTTYHPDPSGNNDSCYTCDICGLEKKRF